MTGRYQEYPEYKNSEIEWLDTIPEHWIATELKRYCNVTDGSHHSPSVQSEGYPFISVTDVGDNEIDFKNCKRITKLDYIRLVKEGCKPQVGDVLLTKDGTIGRATIVKEEDQDFVILSSLGLLSPSNNLNKNFLYYYLVSGINVDQMNSMIHGSALKRMTINKIDSLKITFPAFEEQQKIANFLDHETAKIDTLIAKQEKLIELLKEKRQAVISHAVTRGLNPDAPMKDSGVEWLGEVPKHWVIKQLKHCFTLQRGHDLASTQFKKGKYPVYGSNGVIGHHAEFTTYAPCITVGRSGSVGEVNFINENFWAHNTSLYLKSYNNSEVRYIYYFLLSMDLKSLAAGSAVGSLDRNNIHCRKIAVPDIEEQTEIAEYLEKQLAKFDLMNQKSIKGISLLKERKITLISAAVTGKIDVRNWKKQ